jgi:quinol monooxygenase YgiN
MVTVALFVRLEAKPGKEVEVSQFLQSGLAIVQQEPDTTAWFAVQTGPNSFAIFDAFPDERGRQAHLTGRLAADLMARASDLFVKPPIIEKMTVLKEKLPVPKS